LPRSCLSKSPLTELTSAKEMRESVETLTPGDALTATKMSSVNRYLQMLAPFRIARMLRIEIRCGKQDCNGTGNHDLRIKPVTIVTRRGGNL